MRAHELTHIMRLSTRTSHRSIGNLTLKLRSDFRGVAFKQIAVDVKTKPNGTTFAWSVHATARLNGTKPRSIIIKRLNEYRYTHLRNWSAIFCVLFSYFAAERNGKKSCDVTAHHTNRFVWAREKTLNDLDLVRILLSHWFKIDK